MTTDTNFIIADYHNKQHAADLLYLLNQYALDPMGGGAPLTEYVQQNLIENLQKTSNAFSVIGYQGENPVALANCFTGLSTFASKPLINIHDLAVVPETRGQGLSQKLLDFVVEEAKRTNCCKVTLEVLSGNKAAKSAYEKNGFVEFKMGDEHGVGLFMQRSVG